MAKKKPARKAKSSHSKKSQQARGSAQNRPKTRKRAGRRATARRKARTIPPTIPLRTEEAIEPIAADAERAAWDDGTDETPRETAQSSLSSIYRLERPPHAGPGPESGGQAGDIQGLSKVAEAAPQSVEELAEEGQDLEAEVIDGVEKAPPADISAVPRPKRPKSPKGPPPTL